MLLSENLCSYSLCATFGISLRSANTEFVHGPAISAEEASVIVSVRVNSPNESLRRPQSKLHPILAADLTH